MNKNEIKARIARLRASGVGKTDVYSELSGRGVNDKQLAYLIASYPDEMLCKEHGLKVKILIAIMLVQALLGFVVGFGVGEEIGLSASWMLGGFIALIPLLFSYGFYKRNASAYYMYFILTIVGCAQTIGKYSSAPAESAMGLAFSVGVLIYVMYVSRSLFPDLLINVPIKRDGRYVFSD